MLQGVDYSFSKPDPYQLAALGKSFVMLYVGPGTDDKHLHAAERDAIWDAGLSICLLVEGTANGALGGYGVGRTHAQLAVNAANALGAPTSLPLYFAVDFDVTTTQWPVVRGYLQGAASVIGLGQVGIYGSIRAMQWAARDNVANWFFQTYAWSGGAWYPGNHVEQYLNGVNMAGGNVDLCRSKKDNFGQWEDRVTPEEIKAIAAEVWNTLISSPSLNYSQPAGEWMKWTYANSLSLGSVMGSVADLETKVDAILQQLENGGPAGLVPHSHVSTVGDAVPDSSHPASG